MSNYEYAQATDLQLEQWLTDYADFCTWFELECESRAICTMYGVAY